MFVDPFELIKTVEPGMMLFGVGGNSPDDTKFVFLIREEEKYLKKIGRYPMVQVRFGIFEGITNAIGALVMVRFENNPDMTYDSWLNYYAPEKHVNKLAAQEQLIFKLYSSTDCVRTLAISNSLAPVLNTYIKKSKKMEWSMNEFDKVKAYIYKKYDPIELWNSLYH
jgi:hypothetical protein